MSDITKFIPFLLINLLGFFSVGICYVLGVITGVVSTSAPGFDAEHFQTWFFTGTIIKAAGEYKDRLHWAAIRTAIRDRRGFPVKIARRPAVLPDVPSETEESHEESRSDVNWEEEDNKARKALEEIYDEKSAEKEASYEDPYEDPGKKRMLNP